MPKRKTLPKDFEEILASGDLAAMQAVFDKCEFDARGGYTKQTALAFNACPDDLTLWLVAQGADLAAEDTYGETPLHARARCWDGKIAVLLELGAPVNHGEGGRGTPLHAAAGSYKVGAATALLAKGADPNGLNREGETPLLHALRRCSNINIEDLVALSETLLPLMAGPAETGGFLTRLFKPAKPTTPVTPEMRSQVTRIGTDFEFSRSAFNKDSVDAVSAALTRLYQLFDVPPVPRRALHDGEAPIKLKATDWRDQHDELWALLVPPQGAATTMQGEAVRLSGRIRRELEGNGGVNWDKDFTDMADAFLGYIQSGQALPSEDLTEAKQIISEVKRRRGDTARLCHLAVDWVLRNPKPIARPKVNYRR